VGTLDAMVALVERQPERFLGVVWEALEAVRDDGRPDHDTRLRALMTALDRAYGKPKQAVDVDHTSGGKTLDQLFAPTPLAQTNTLLPAGDEPAGWEGTA
jgi:hypothetical protein